MRERRAPWPRPQPGFEQSPITSIARICQTIQRAVRFYLAHDAVDQLRQVAGTMDIEDVSRHLRAADRTT